MKLNLVSVLMVAGGITLIYCGVKGYDPRDVIRWSLGGKKPEVAYPLPDGKDEKDTNDPRIPDDLEVQPPQKM